MKRVEVFVTPKKGVLDPQGKAIESTLSLQGVSGVEQVRLGRYIAFKMAQADEKQVEQICETLLANTVVEDYRFTITDGCD